MFFSCSLFLLFVLVVCYLFLFVQDLFGLVLVVCSCLLCSSDLKKSARFFSCLRSGEKETADSAGRSMLLVLIVIVSCCWQLLLSVVVGVTVVVGGVGMALVVFVVSSQ